jgi:hypothetical protein
MANRHRDPDSRNEIYEIARKSGLFGVLDKQRVSGRLRGGRTRARTWDPLIKSQLLYQLSYAPGTGPEKGPSQEGVV